MDYDLLQQHVTNGVVRAQQHPCLPLTIYNYSERCQYDRLWDDVTLQCRGLVMHGERIVARPFRKFFNDTEHKDGEIPWHLPHVITEKMDGSLLIVFHFDGEWHFCTRGSFTSEQATMGTELFYGSGFNTDWLDTEYTYLFEVIYPENRIVVDYGDKRTLVLLGAIETATGSELPPTQFSGIFEVVKTVDYTVNTRNLRALIRDDQEGYVVRFENGFRIKIKGERYKELHRILSGVSSRMIWEHLSNGTPLDDILEIVPDEFADWVRDEITLQRGQFNALAAFAQRAAASVVHLPTRKEQAQVILSEHKGVSAAAFQMLDGKDATKVLWQMVYPDVRKPAISQRLSG